MTTWVLADPHAGADPAGDEALVAMLERARAAEVDLLIMGDLFAAWIGVEAFLTDLQRRVLDRIAAIRETGRVRFVVGNRDYLAERMTGRAFDEVIDGEAIIDLEGIPTLVAHGDLLNERDRPYRAWRRLSRSRVVSLALPRLPARLGRQIPAWLERRLRNVNVTHKTGMGPLPAAGIERIAERARNLGAERVLLGHFHAPARIDTTPVPVVVAPGWCEHRRVIDGETLA